MLAHLSPALCERRLSAAYSTTFKQIVTTCGSRTVIDCPEPYGPTLTDPSITTRPLRKLVKRGGSDCLNSFVRFAKWISASITPPPSSVPAR
jgi:rRNA maturation protein Nop10